MIATTRAAPDPKVDLNQETSIEDDLFPQEASGLTEARVTVRAR